MIYFNEESQPVAATTALDWMNFASLQTHSFDTTSHADIDQKSLQFLEMSKHNFTQQQVNAMP